eukprot:m.70675 g.70675  ORF g.70675 m.70675 type:complete len:547 (+) comp8661_c0_seq1:3579-5219(+)
MLTQAQTAELKALVTARLKDSDLMVDEELADYVCVLVQNEKTQSEIAADLELFLQTEAAPFAVWLEEQTAKLRAPPPAPAAPLPSIVVRRKSSSSHQSPSAGTRRDSHDDSHRDRDRGSGDRRDSRGHRRDAPRDEYSHRDRDGGRYGDRSRRSDHDRFDRRDRDRDRDRRGSDWRDSERMSGWREGDGPVERDGDSDRRQSRDGDSTPDGEGRRPGAAGLGKRAASMAFKSAIASVSGDGAKRLRSEVESYGWKPKAPGRQEQNSSKGLTSAHSRLGGRLGTQRDTKQGLQTRARRSNVEVVEDNGSDGDSEEDGTSSGQPPVVVQDEEADSKRTPIESRLGPRIPRKKTQPQPQPASTAVPMMMPQGGYVVVMGNAAPPGRGRGWAGGRAYGRGGRGVGGRGGRTFQRFEAFAGSPSSGGGKGKVDTASKPTGGDVAAVKGMLNLQEKRQALLNEQLSQQKALMAKLDKMPEGKTRKETMKMLMLLSKSITSHSDQLRATAADIEKAQSQMDSRAAATKAASTASSKVEQPTAESKEKKSVEAT